MQLAPTAIRPADAPAPTPRQEAAKALIAVPMGVVMTATMSAMSKQMSGQTNASRAELLAPMLEKATVEQLAAAMTAGIEGAIALEPQLAGRSEAMRQAAAAVAALVTESAADTTSRPIKEAVAAIATPLQAAMTPLVEAALVLDPTLMDQKPRPFA